MIADAMPLYYPAMPRLLSKEYEETEGGCTCGSGALVHPLRSCIVLLNAQGESHKKLHCNSGLLAILLRVRNHEVQTSGGGPPWTLNWPTCAWYTGCTLCCPSSAAPARSPCTNVAWDNLAPSLHTLGHFKQSGGTHTAANAHGHYH